MNTRLTAALLIAAFGLAACEEQGPLERAGERADDAIDEVRGEESLQNRVEDAADEIEDAADDLDN